MIHSHSDPWKKTLQGLGQPGIPWDCTTYGSLLQWCGKAKALPDGQLVHAHIIKTGLEQNVVLAARLVQMYSQCDESEMALATFANMNNPNVFLWNVMIRAYVQGGHGQIALHFFEQMHCEGVLPDIFTFGCILSACACEAGLVQGKCMHARIVGCEFVSDLVVGNTLLSMYAKCRSLEDVCLAFEQMDDHNVISWTAMIAAFAQHGREDNALRFFDRMQGEGVLPDKVTFLSILSAFANKVGLADGKRIHALFLGSGFELDVVVGTALVNMYGKCGSLDDAQMAFNKMPERSVVSWNSIIALYAQSEFGNVAIQLFGQMQQEAMLPDKVTFISIVSACASQALLAEGKQMLIRSLSLESDLDIVLATAVVNMYGKCGSLEQACEVFDKIRNPNLISWNSIIGAYVQHGQPNDAFLLFGKMHHDGVVPDRVTFVTILDACASQVALPEGEHMHSCILEMDIELDVVLGTALVDMYCKCSSLEAARRQFDEMPDRNVFSWNAMVAGYSQHGKGRDAMQLFDRMHWEGVLPDRVTFVSILDACNCESTMSEGVRMHTRIIDHGFEADIIMGNALLSMYCMYGSIEQAQKMFEKMPRHDVISWTILISVYVDHGRNKEALHLVDQMQLEYLMPVKATFVTILEACTNLSELTKGEQIHAFIMDNGVDSDIVLLTALVNMYGKCGSLQIARKMFNQVSKKDMVLYTTMIAVHAHHGQGKEAFHLFEQMKSEGIMPNEVTFVSILVACSHEGLINEGCHAFTVMTQDHAISPTVNHYDCLIDLFGRAGLLEKAEELIYRMPFPPTIMSFVSLLGACRYQADVERGARAAKCAFMLDPENSAPYIMLSSLYTMIECGIDAEKAVQKQARE